MIFIKNLVYGKVKTRLAATIGPLKALHVYKELITYTRSVANRLSCDKILYYTSVPGEMDIWNDQYKFLLQKGDDLGERMKNAFRETFQQGYLKVVIIGTDTPSIDATIINEAFDKLQYTDIVVGPAFDGGYYLLGMKQMQICLFEGIEWSTGDVFKTTIERCKENHLSYHMLQYLHDIDEEKDLVHLKALKL